MPTIAEALALQKVDILNQLKPLQDFLAAQQKGADPKPAAPSWQAKFNQATASWLEGPKQGQVIASKKDGSYELLQAGAAMGAGGLLGVIERPINSLWPAIPLGSIAVGAVSGMFLGELIDGFLPPRTSADKIDWTNVAVKAGTAVALALYGNRLMSGTATFVAVGLLASQVLADTLPLDAWIKSVVDWFKNLFGKNGTTTAAQRMREVPAPGGFAGRQSRNDLYSGIFGGG